MKRIGSWLTAACLATCLGLGAQSSRADEPAAARSRSPHANEVAAAQAALAWKLISALPDEGQIVVSPASLGLAISTVALGANATMREALVKASGFSGLSSEEATLWLAEARTTLAHADPATFVTADRFVYSPEYPIPSAMIAKLDQHDVSHEALDLSQQAAVDAVDAWVKQTTRGEIDGILHKPLDRGSAVALNALYFKAKWREPFDAKATKDADFFEAGGAKGRVRMMYKGAEFRAREAPGFVGVELPFAGERYAMTIVTTTDRPSPRKRFAEVGGWLSGAEFFPRKVFLYLPRFHADMGKSLLAALAPDLRSAMQSPAPFEGFGDRFVLGDILQRTKVEVDEEGAKAAAATGIVMEMVSERPKPPPPLTVTVDKPFIFALRDRDSGLILAAGYVGKAPAP